MMRELGGVFGIAVAVAVFAAAGSYASVQAFTDGFTPAILVAAGLSLAGAITGLALPGRRQAAEGLVADYGAVPALEAEGVPLSARSPHPPNGGITMSIKRAVVIGAGSGVGKATASALADGGAQVVAAGRERDATDPEQVAALLAEADPDLVVVAAGRASAHGSDRGADLGVVLGAPGTSTSRSPSRSAAPRWPGRFVQTRRS